MMGVNGQKRDHYAIMESERGFVLVGDLEDGIRGGGEANLFGGIAVFTRAGKV